MPESMSATEAIRKVAESLNDAAMMLAYIADSLDHEFALAAERGRRQQSANSNVVIADLHVHADYTNGGPVSPRQLPSENMGALDDWEF